MIFRPYQRWVGNRYFEYWILSKSESSDDNYENPIEKHDFKLKIKTEVLFLII